MTVKDIIKGKVYEQIAGGTGISFNEIVVTLILACIIGIYIFLVYKLLNKAAFYSKDLNVTIAGMSVVVAAIMIAMQSNLIVSLGMVGALSIVRFRNAVKNPLDLLYIFWAVSAGIICGVGLNGLAIILCIIMTLLIMILGCIPNIKAASLLIVRAEEDIKWEMVKAIIKQNSKFCKEKSFNISKSETELIMEVVCKNSDVMMSELKKIEGLSQVNLLSHEGEYRI